VTEKSATSPVEGNAIMRKIMVAEFISLDGASCEEPTLSLSKGREPEMPPQSGFDHLSTTKSNSTGRAAN
jgi:hypothetical protein